MARLNFLERPIERVAEELLYFSSAISTPGLLANAAQIVGSMTFGHARLFTSGISAEARQTTNLAPLDAQKPAKAGQSSGVTQYYQVLKFRRPSEQLRLYSTL